MNEPRSQDSQPATRAQSISRWACILVSATAVGIAGITFRVVQLKTNPGPKLIASMQDANGKLAQQISVSDPLPRGEILDRFGRTLALDALGGSLYLDVRDLYRDTQMRNEVVAKRIAAGKAREHDRIILDPISELAAQLGPMLGVPQDEIVHRIVDLDPKVGDHLRVPATLRKLPASGDLQPDQWLELPRYIVVEKALNDEQIRLLRTAKEAGGPTSIVRAAHFEPKQERVRPYGDIAAGIVGKTGIDVVSDIPLVVDVRSLYREAYAYNIEAIQLLSRGENARVIDDPVGELATALSPLIDMPANAIATAILGEVDGQVEARVKAWSLTMQMGGGLDGGRNGGLNEGLNEGLDEDLLDTMATSKLVKAKTTQRDRDQFAAEQKLETAAPALAYAKLLPGTEETVGRSGIERIANKDLSSKPGYTTYFASRLGSVISIPPGGYRAGDAGDSVRLSIDIVIQEMVEARVNEVVDAANASGGRALVINAHTGEILAAYSRIRGNTGRDPITTDFAKGDAALARMRWATDPFEPGSIFKPFVWAWAVDHGFARRDETISLPSGPLTLVDGRAKRTIREAHTSSYGTRTWEQVLVKSVNAGMATIAMRMGSDEMKRCLAAWKFGVGTSVGVENESKGLMPRADEWSSKTRALASVSFGQGIAVTPLQLVRAFSAFCREGDMVPLSLQPFAHDSLTGSMPVLSTNAVRESREVMQKVITEGTGKKLKEILVYSAFGKSGTAQLTKEMGGYFADRYMASFIAGAPFDRPEIIVLVTIEDPDKKAKATGGATGGGALAGPAVGHIINDVLGYMGLPTDGELVYAEKTDEQKKMAAR